MGYRPGDWRRLFNGRDLTGWTPKIRRHELGDNYADTFRVRDGALEVAYDGYDTFGEQFGHLFFAEPFSRYRLRLEYRFVGAQAPDAPSWAERNSGVIARCSAGSSSTSRICAAPLMTSRREDAARIDVLQERPA